MWLTGSTTGRVSAIALLVFGVPMLARGCASGPSASAIVAIRDDQRRWVVFDPEPRIFVGGSDAYPPDATVRCSGAVLISSAHSRLGRVIAAQR